MLPGQQTAAPHCHRCVQRRGSGQADAARSKRKDWAIDGDLAGKGQGLHGSHAPTGLVEPNRRTLDHAAPAPAGAGFSEHDFLRVCQETDDPDTLSAARAVWSRERLGGSTQEPWARGGCGYSKERAQLVAAGS